MRCAAYVRKVALVVGEAVRQTTLFCPAFKPAACRPAEGVAIRGRKNGSVRSGRTVRQNPPGLLIQWSEPPAWSPHWKGWAKAGAGALVVVSGKGQRMPTLIRPRRDNGVEVCGPDMVAV